MRKTYHTILAMTLALLSACAGKSDKKTNPMETINECKGTVDRLEPRSWWVGMKTPLQLMVQGADISAWTVSMVANDAGVRIAKVHKAESPNFLFVDVTIPPNAPAGTYDLLFTKGREQFKIPYTLDARRPHSAERKSFSTADMVYLLMPDRFANGDPSNDSTADTAEAPDRKAFFGRHGGDIQGIIDHLDYLQDLGTTALWSTPLLLDNEPKESYHGYACSDYYRIDPRFGSNELYQTMVSKAHEKGIKVIMDIVTNHCGTAHWWMKDLPFADWIHQHPQFTGTNHLFSTNMDPNASQYDLKTQESGWFVASMADMNLNNPFLLHYFKQWAVWWIEFADLDGFRVDTYPYNEKLPMSEWNQAILAEFPHFNIVGECWTSSIPQLAYWQANNRNRDGFNSHLPSIMDFPLRDALCEAMTVDESVWGGGMLRVYNALSHDFVYEDLSNMLIFAANHDTDRITDILEKDVKSAKIIMTLLATMRGIPQLFAGDELMFVSKDRSQGHGGLRVDFPGGWAADKVDLFDEAQRDETQAAIHAHTKRLFNWRKGATVVQQGKTLHFASRDNTYAFFRYNDTDAVFVYVNNSKETKLVPWGNYAEISDSLTDGYDVLADKPTTIDAQTAVASKESIVVSFKRKQKTL